MPMISVAAYSLFHNPRSTEVNPESDEGEKSVHKMRKTHEILTI